MSLYSHSSSSFGHTGSESLLTHLGKKIISFGSVFLILISFCVTPDSSLVGAYGWPQGTDSQIPEDISLSADGYLQKSSVGFEKSNYKEISEPFSYVVQDGDTYESIAEEFDLDKETIFSNNTVRNKNYPYIGQILKIPPVKGVIHTIKRGDTLNGIAQLYGVDAQKIQRQNGLSLEDTLIISRELIIPGGKPLYKAPAKATYQNTYATDTSAKGTLIRPTEGVYTQYYHRGHYAVDIADKSMPKVWAAKGGTVVEVRTAGWNYGYGKYVIIDHGNGLRTLYSHLASISVADGESVVKGQQIGIMGTTGRSTGVHLHFEVIKNGYKKNPIAYF